MSKITCRVGAGRRFATLACLMLLAVPRPASPQSRNAEDYLLLARKSAKVSKYSTISGNIGVNDPRGRLGVSPRARRGGKQIVADIVWVGSESQVLDVFANVLHVGARAVVGGTITQPIASPIYDPETLIVPDPFDPANLPPAFPITCGGPDLRGGFRETITLTPGVYGDVRPDKGGKLVLGPGS